MNNPATQAGDGVITCDACPVLCRIRPYTVSYTHLTLPTILRV